MPRILIPSDNQDFVGPLAQAYRRLGCEIVVGQFNLTLRGADFDLVHVQWPEELSGWRPPSQERLNLLLDSLDYWAARSKVLLTVHNLYPHGHAGADRYFELFDGFYRRAGLIHHFSQTSRDLVRATFPSSRDKAHVVTNLFNYDSLLAPSRDRSAARTALGLADNELVVLIFGALRMWKEVKLIRSAWGFTSVKNKRLLMAGRYNEIAPGSAFSSRYKRWSWKMWLRSQKAVRIDDYVPDSQVHRLFDAADFAVIPRVEGLSSGIPSMAMTFGKLFVAPRHGAFPEYVGNSGNVLYESCDPVSLAKAIETAAALDRDRIGRENRRVADAWSWDGIAAQCLNAGLVS
jgi:glycosyltransferase involved in cell wall biosynthesis